MNNLLQKKRVYLFEKKNLKTKNNYREHDHECLSICKIVQIGMTLTLYFQSSSVTFHANCFPLSYKLVISCTRRSSSTIFK